MRERLKLHFEHAYDDLQELNRLIRSGRYRRRVERTLQGPSDLSFRVVEEVLDPSSGEWVPYSPRRREGDRR